MNAGFDETVTTQERLREIIGVPSRRMTSKAMDHVDGIRARYVAASPYVICGRRGERDVPAGGDRPHRHERIRLSDIADARQRIEGGHERGNLVIETVLPADPSPDATVRRVASVRPAPRRRCRGGSGYPTS